MTTPKIVDVKAAQFLTLEGTGAPGGEAFSAAVAALYGVAFTTKMRKKKSGRDYAVGKLEALWHIEGPQSSWRKKGSPLAANVALEDFREGRCVEMLHVGPYTEHAREKGYAFDGLHHQIYISDPRRVAPEKLKTTLRRPLKPRRDRAC